MNDIKKMTAEQRQALLAELQAAEQAEKERREAEISAYKKMACDTVAECFPRLEAVSRELIKEKRSIREAFSAVISFKTELYGKQEGPVSHQFMSEDGKFRIRIGYYTLDSYDDTVNNGIAKVKEYINSLARDEQSRILVETVLKLLSKDSKGTLKASRVLQLQQMAEKSGHAGFMEGVRIIRDAYRPIESKSYIRAERKTEGGWVAVPLGMTDAE